MVVVVEAATKLSDFAHFWRGAESLAPATEATSEPSKVVRAWCVLYVLTSKFASRHWLRARRFSEPTFRPSGATNHWKKHSVSRLSYLFARLHLLSSDSFSSLIFSLLLFSLLLFSSL